jgi:hypothetical protein
MNTIDRHSDEWCESQFRKYMAAYTDKSLEQVYNIYLKKKWTPKESELMEKINELGLWRGSNPYIFRLMD